MFQTHIPGQLEPLQAPIKDLVQFFRELANKQWEVCDKTQTNLPARRQQPPKTGGFPQGALLSIQEFYTFQWPLQLQRIKFSSLSVICQLICRKGVVLHELHTKACLSFGKGVFIGIEPSKLQLQLLNYCLFQ